MSELIMANGASMDVYQDLLKRKAPPEGKSRIVGLTTWKQSTVFGSNISGAATKKGKWRKYYAMYSGHSIVRGAIEKIAKSAANTGYDFVARDKRVRVKDEEIAILKEFFDKQVDFIGELREIYKDLLICGDAYMYIVPDRLRRPARLKRLHPRTIHIKVANNGRILAYYQQDTENFNERTAVEFEPHEIIHFRISDPDNQIYGLSLLESLEWAVTADLYAQRYNAAFFKNSGITGTVIGIKKASQEELARNKLWLEENYTGPEAAHKPIIIEGENITVQHASPTHTEMGFLEGRKFIIMEILAVLDVPPAKLGMMETANRSNAKEQDKTFRTEAVSPLQIIVEQTINSQFIRPILGVESTDFVHSEGDSRDAMETMEYVTKGLEKGIFNVNEVRDILGMAPVEGGDINTVNTSIGLIPLDRVDLYFQVPATNIDKVPVGRDSPSGEPIPKVIRTRTTGSSPRLSKSELVISLSGAMIHLEKAREDSGSLLQAYSLVKDVADEDDSFTLAADALRRANVETDTLLKESYIQRAERILYTKIMGDTHER